ncbi:hypothetical protein FMEAI12_1680002 [Parafrankia sp. Ea1.12]|nr:hypothetical protein FMEAI12_1680002 [Parafrankia sp. Ea1.12]
MRPVGSRPEDQDAGVRARLAWRAPARRGPLVDKLEDLFRLWLAKPRPDTVGPHLLLPVLRAGDRPRRERGGQPGSARRPRVHRRR